MRYDRATRNAITKTYVASFRWFYLNPNKMASSWESATYEFHADGTYTRTYDPGEPTVETGKWRLDRSTLVIDDWRMPLAACRQHAGYFCGAGFYPTAAE